MPTVKELKAVALELGIPNAYKMLKDELTTAISLAKTEIELDRSIEDNPDEEKISTVSPAKTEIDSNLLTEDSLDEDKKSSISLNDAEINLDVLDEDVSTSAPKTKPRQSWFSGEARLATVLLIAIGFTLAYLTRPEPAWYDNLMGYLPF